MTPFQIVYNAGPNGHWIYLLVTLLLGATTAYVSGKSIAETWRPLWQALVYALVIGLAVRFIHFALFNEVFVSARNYAIDCVPLLAAAIAGFMLARRRQMRAQYGWTSPTPSVPRARATQE